MTQTIIGYAVARDLTRIVSRELYETLDDCARVARIHAAVSPDHNYRPVAIVEVER
ncbi:MAG: hypothetical protein QM804_10210 [Propionicimonas sp.]